MLTPAATSLAATSQPTAPPRTLGFWSALSANLLNMIGIGPFITIPLALSALAGPAVLLGWLAGALLCLCDGLVWAELGSAIPRSGGPYHYLREAYGRERWGRLFGFLYLWQTLLTAPLSVASAAVGCAQYLAFLLPGLQQGHRIVMAMALCLFNTALLYRRVRSVQMLSVAISAVVLAACAWIVLSGLLHFDMRTAGDFLHARAASPQGFWLGFGAVALIAVYDYGGYNNVCMLGGEIRKPRRTIPRAVLISIPLVALLYMGLNISLLGVLPWQQAAQSKAVVADFMQAIYGPIGGTVAVLLIVLASWGSALVVLLGYSRVPYAAAASGQFFAVFARLHPRGGFPTVSLVSVGIGSALACLLSLDDLIATLMIIQILFQFLAQCLAVMLLRRDRPRRGRFTMPLYPWPLLISVIGWLSLLATSPGRRVLAALAALGVGAALYLIQARRTRTWPFPLQ
ncbi:APC family permease [Xanthomonas maliensis]|uniref:APC family permease n=1 Tax=Xanthomonas maliensis TaxID=1321368 RepID=UPI000399B60A|nr:APC family permease [Xanthomonas maliensis]KAB7772204.1 amino acid permease [Xanthomonas maliensis]